VRLVEQSVRYPETRSFPGEVAQSVEHTAENRGVAGSIPALAIASGVPTFLMTGLYPEIEPYEHGLPDVGDGNLAGHAGDNPELVREVIRATDRFASPAP
jgi:hypothetical protein